MLRRRGKIAGMAVLAGLFPMLASAAFSETWTSYANARFGTRADVPSEGFSPDRPPENGGGQSWTAEDGKARISVYGTFIAVAEDFAGYRQFTLNAARENGVDITYSAGKKDWFAYSGFVDGDIVYEKAVLSRRCEPDVAHHISLRYPAEQRARYDPIVTRMAKSLRGGRGADCE